jgi:hypothetical protein
MEKVMDWLNIFGLIMIAVIMIPNIIFAVRCKEGFQNKWSNKYVEVVECGVFGGDMKVSLVNQGPFTIILDESLLDKDKK